MKRTETQEVRVDTGEDSCACGCGHDHAPKGAEAQTHHSHDHGSCHGHSHSKGDAIFNKIIFGAMGVLFLGALLYKFLFN